MTELAAIADGVWGLETAMRVGPGVVFPLRLSPPAA